MPDSHKPASTKAGAVQFPAKGFADLEAARAWASRFVRWYNHGHLHSGIRYVSPADRHDGHDGEILQRRHALYLEARQRNPRRWSRHTHNWSRVDVVTLNPERNEVVAPTAAAQTEKHRLAA